MYMIPQWVSNTQILNSHDSPNLYDFLIRTQKETYDRMSYNSVTLYIVSYCALLKKYCKVIKVRNLISVLVF